MVQGAWRILKQYDEYQTDHVINVWAFVLVPKSTKSHSSQHWQVLVCILSTKQTISTGDKFVASKCVKYQIGQVSKQPGTKVPLIKKHLQEEKWIKITPHN